jgi:hypothetical protein
MKEFDGKMALMECQPPSDGAKMPWGRIVLSHQLMGAAPVSYDYYQDCKDHNARLKKLSDKVEISLYTCVWLTG